MPTRVSARWLVLLIAGSLFCVSEPGKAQGDQSAILSATPRGSTTNFHFAEPNELTIVVSLLGSVQRPGRYEISRTIDLPNLLSLAGGTIPGASVGDIRIMRTTKVGSRVERKEIRMDLEQQLMNPAADLQLNQGDLIVVPQSSWVAINDVLTVLTTAAVITTAIVSVINITR